MRHRQCRRHFKTSWSHGTDCYVIKRMVSITGNPQSVEKNSKFAGDRYNGSLLTIFSTSLEHSSTPAFEVTVRAKTSQQILRTLNQQRAELFVAGLADSQLLLDRAGLVATWRQPEICRYVSGMSEPAGVAYSKHVLQRCDRPHSAYLAEPIGLWVAILRRAFNCFVQGIDLFVQM